MRSRREGGLPLPCTSYGWQATLRTRSKPDRGIKRARLKDAIDRGYEDAATGRVIRFETDDQIDAFFADL